MLSPHRLYNDSTKTLLEILNFDSLKFLAKLSCYITAIISKIEAIMFNIHPNLLARDLEISLLFDYKQFTVGLQSVLLNKHGFCSGSRQNIP